MNTVEKGDKFEDKVYKVLKNLLEEEKLPLSKERTKVFQKKKYYSPIQKCDIIFDISIESYMPNEKDYSFLWLIECKDYKSPIEVSKIRNFKTQIEEVGGHKGLFVTTSKFQKGAINLAKGYGMGLAIMQENDSLNWTVKRNSINKKSYYHISNVDNLFSERGKSLDGLFLGVYNDKIFDNLVDFLSYAKLNIISQKCEVPYLKEKDIETIALESVGKMNSLQNYYLASQEIINALNTKYYVNVEFDALLEDNELGKVDLRNNVIYLSDKLQYDSPRWRFTLAHEFGHIVLHKSFLIENNIYVTSERESHFDYYLTNNNTAKIEMQANFFATHLLIPDIALGIEVVKFKNEFRIQKDHICYDNQPVNIELCNNLFTRLSVCFGVSKEVAKYRLLNLRILKDLSNITTVRGKVY